MQGSPFIDQTFRHLNSLPAFDNMSKDECNILLNMLLHTADAIHASLQKRKTCPGMYWLLWSDAATTTKRPRRIECNGNGKFQSNFFGPPDPMTGKEYGQICDTCGKAWQRAKKQKVSKGGGGVSEK